MNNFPKLLRESCDLMTALAASIGHRINPQRAERVIYETHGNQPSESDGDWFDIMCSCSEALEFRVRGLNANIVEVVPLVRSGLTLATLGPTDNGGPTWLLISKVVRNRVLVENMRTGKSFWCNVRKLHFQLGLANNQTASNWLVSYPILMQSPDAAHSGGGHGPGHGHGHWHGMSPWRRLTQLLRPESGDLWVVGIFALMVGLLTLTTPIATEALVNTVAFGQFSQPVIVLAFIVLIFLVFSSVITALQTYVVEILQRRLFVRLVEDLAYRLPRVCQKEIDSSSLPELTNRFLEIGLAQKAIAKLLLDGISIILQTFIGMAVLAFYHPFLLGFDIVLLALIAFALFVLGRGAIRTAIEESYNKYRVLEWLEELGRNQTAFKLNSGTEFATNRADHLAIGYLDARQEHFRIVLRQVIFSLGIYCFATTVLLGLGGWLVIAGELSLGQLVAAELIVILIVRSFSKLGQDMEGFYDLMASIDKIGVLLDLQMEPQDKLLELNSDAPLSVEFSNVGLKILGKSIAQKLDFSIPAGGMMAVVGGGEAATSHLVDLCVGLRKPNVGLISINGVNIDEYRQDIFREGVGVARGIEIFTGTIDENVHLNRPSVSSWQVWNILNKVGLNQVVEELDDGLQTHLLSGGFPLTQNQSRRLMLARALASRPRLLIIDNLLDCFSRAEAEKLVDDIRDDSEMTMLVFTECQEIGSLFPQTVSVQR